MTSLNISFFQIPEKNGQTTLHPNPNPITSEIYYAGESVVIGSGNSSRESPSFILFYFGLLFKIQLYEILSIVINCFLLKLEDTRICTIRDGNAKTNFNNSTTTLLENVSAHRRLPLPLELNCQIFQCFKFEKQRKFIGGLGRGIYGIFRQQVLTKVLKKSKKLQNPEQNGWQVSNTGAIISFNGLLASDNTGTWQNVYAKKKFPITGELSRTDNFPGTILYYFEVTNMSSSYMFVLLGFSCGNIPHGTWIGEIPNSYAILHGWERFLISGVLQEFDSLNEAITTNPGRVVGCGLLMNPENELSIFFTINGILMGKQILIFPTVSHLFPTLSMHGNVLMVEANFGDDLAKPFKYDIKKCPGLVFV